MQDIIIDEEFRDLLPQLSAETYGLLEENLIANGCRDALVLWNGTLVDGHNRYEICKKHNIPFATVDKEFASRENALIWIISTQVARRSLSSMQLSNYRGLHYIMDKKNVTNTSGKNQFSKHDEDEPLFEVQPDRLSTATRLARHYKVSRATIERDAKLAEAIEAIGKTSPEARRKILSSEVSLRKKYLQDLSVKPQGDITGTATRIENGTFEKEQPVKPAPLPLDAVINKLANDLYSDLQKLTKDDDTNEFKTALKACISILEDLYKRVA